MNARLVGSFMFTLLLSTYVPGQQTPQGGDVIGSVGRTGGAGGEYKQELLHRIAIEEAVARQAESAHTTCVVLSRIYVQLGLLYQDVAQWERSEQLMERAVSLLRRSSTPTDDLASALGHLGSLHVEMGKLRDSEKEELEGLKIRQDLGDRLQIARSQSDLVTLYLVKQKFVKARDLARLALAEFDTNRQADVLDRISIRFALSEALCSIKDCASAIPMLKVAMDEAKATLRPDDFPVGLSGFLLGYAYWKSGNMAEAGEYMERGIALMSAQLGWGHPAYLRTLRCYAQFLRETKQIEAANVVERRIRQAEAVVDVHSIQSGQGAFSFAGLR